MQLLKESFEYGVFVSSMSHYMVLNHFNHVPFL